MSSLLVTGAQASLLGDDIDIGFLISGGGFTDIGTFTVAAPPELVTTNFLFDIDAESIAIVYIGLNNGVLFPGVAFAGFFFTDLDSVGAPGEIVGVDENSLFMNGAQVGFGPDFVFYNLANVFLVSAVPGQIPPSLAILNLDIVTAEPSTVLLLGVGVVALAQARRRRST